MAMLTRSLLPSTVSTTLHAFPSLLPTRTAQLSSRFLAAPLRRDILHRAVIFERDALRQGTASTKTRAEVSGSTRKMRKQKGSGQSRMGTRTSPILRGGGRAHGPKPRDFSTELPRKVYNMAVRTAFSHLYASNVLTCVDGQMDLPTYKTAASRQFLEAHGFAARGEPNGRTLFLVNNHRKNLELSTGNLGYLCEVMHVDDMLICELLKYSRILVENSALEEIEAMTRD